MGIVAERCWVILKNMAVDRSNVISCCAARRFSFCTTTSNFAVSVTPGPFSYQHLSDTLVTFVTILM